MNTNDIKKASTGGCLPAIQIYLFSSVQHTQFESVLSTHGKKKDFASYVLLCTSSPLYSLSYIRKSATSLFPKKWTYAHFVWNILEEYNGILHSQRKCLLKVCMKRTTEIKIVSPALSIINSEPQNSNKPRLEFTFKSVWREISYWNWWYQKTYE